MDVVVPDMAYAALALPPVRDATAAGVDDGAARERAGVPGVVNLGDAVAVIADSYWTASRALKDLQIDWQGGQTELATASVRATQESDLDRGGFEMMDEAGDVEAAPGTRVETRFEVPYLAHATIEPMNATVSVRADAADIWIGHQNPMHARNAAADILGLDATQVTVHPTYLGGGFGRRGEMDFVSIATRVGQAAGRPVKVIWSREADMANDTYRHSILSRMSGSVGDGRITGVRNHYIARGRGCRTVKRPGPSSMTWITGPWAV